MLLAVSGSVNNYNVGRLGSSRRSTTIAAATVTERRQGNTLEVKNGC